jgi:poly(ADP-ribose) glycohydrolase ARH3
LEGGFRELHIVFNYVRSNIIPMPHSTPSLPDRFAGSLLGLAIGDALGASFENQSPESIARQYRTARELIENPPPGELGYTDDTQMAIGVAETLITCGQIDEQEICRRFADNYQPQRGYGRGARVVLDAMVEGHDDKYLAANLFRGGSFGNGAAMRVAPVGLKFRHAHDKTWEQARLSALPTHVHPLAIEGAQLFALAVGLAATADEFDRQQFFNTLTLRCASLEFSGPLARAARLTNRRDLALFGNGVEAMSSVVTAIASFALTPESFTETIGNVILLGGDTDTLAAMAGAISGAYLGHSAIPNHLLDKLEDRHKGRKYIEELASHLLD